MRSVVHISCPAYENLSLEHIFNFFPSSPPVMQYLPEPSELRKVPKAWTCNIGASVIGKYLAIPPVMDDRRRSGNTSADEAILSAASSAPSRRLSDKAYRRSVLRLGQPAYQSAQR